MAIDEKTPPPTTEQVRMVYECGYHPEYSPRGNFGVWLRSLMADAWSQGWEAAESQETAADFEDLHNPYRDAP